MKKVFIIVKKHSNWIALAFFLSLMLYLHQFIFLYGDDFVYGCYTNGSISDFLNKHFQHYITINGRAIVHIIVSILLAWDVYLWRILNPIIIVVFILLLSILSSSDKKHFKTNTFLSILLFSIININIMRESVFWLDGSINYFFPMVLLLLNIIFVRKSINQGKTYYWLPIIGFLSGATVEQAGMMTVGILCFLLLNAQFINKKRISKVLYINFFVTVLGYLTVVMAPGNIVRSSTNDYKVLTNIANLLRLNFMSEGINIYILLLMLSTICWLYYFKKKGLFIKLNKFLIKLMYINFTLYILFSFFIGNIIHLCNIIYNKNMQLNQSLWDVTALGKDNRIGIIIGCIVSLICVASFLILLYVGFMAYIKEKEERVLVFSLAGMGAQIMLIIAPVYGYRTLLPTLVAWFVIILVSLAKNIESKFTGLVLFLIITFATYNIFIWTFSILLALAYLILDNSAIGKKVRILMTMILYLSSFFFTWINIKGYKENSFISKYNLEAINQLKRMDNDNQEVLKLKKYVNFEYHYLMPYESAWHMGPFKEYYNIPDETQVTFDK